MSRKIIKTYPYKEEVANTVTHGVGLAASIIGLIILLQLQVSTQAALWTAWIFGISMILCYGSSTLYHAVSNRKWKFYFKIADHIAIYLLIAGTYTPFTYFIIGGTTGWIMLGAIWTLAAIGVVFKIFFINRFQLLSTYLYLGMGWLAVLAIKPILSNLDWSGVLLLFAGGLSYSLGVIFFLKEKIPFNHAIWHLFVMGGSLCHFLCIYFYVIR